MLHSLIQYGTIKIFKYKRTWKRLAICRFHHPHKRKEEEERVWCSVHQTRPKWIGHWNSEESLINQLDNFLRYYGTMVEQILIYTHNSPCLKRGKTNCPLYVSAFIQSLWIAWKVSSFYWCGIHKALGIKWSKFF